MSTHQDDEGATDSDGSSECDRALYGSPTLPTIAVSSSGPGAADGMSSFFQAFPTHWLSSTDEQKRTSREARRRSATVGASTTPNKERQDDGCHIAGERQLPPLPATIKAASRIEGPEARDLTLNRPIELSTTPLLPANVSASSRKKRHEDDNIASTASKRELPPLPTALETSSQIELLTFGLATPAVPTEPPRPASIPTPAFSAAVHASGPQAITTGPVVPVSEDAASGTTPRPAKAAPPALLGLPRSPPRMGYSRSQSMQTVAMPVNGAPARLPDAPRRVVQQSSSLYNIRNAPLSAPAHKTSFADLARFRSRGDMQPSPSFRTDIFAARPSISTEVDSEEEDDSVARPPPFFYARSSTLSEADHMDLIGEGLVGERGSFYAQSSRGSTCDVSDTLSITSAGGKKSMLKMAMSKSIPRAISKHLLRKQSSSELSKLVADESFTCLGGDSHPEDIVIKQNAGLKTVPDSFKRLFTPPNSAPPVPPLPIAWLRDHSSLPTLPSQTLASPRGANMPMPSSQLGPLPRLASQMSIAEVTIPDVERPPTPLRTTTPDLTPSREYYFALPPVNIGAPVSLLPAAILRENRPHQPRRTGSGGTSFSDSSAFSASCSPTVSTACSSMYGSSSAASSDPSLILRTPDAFEGQAGGASVFVSGEQTPVRRRRDGRQDFGSNKIGTQGFFAGAATTEPDSCEDAIVQKRDVPVSQGRTPPTRTSTVSSSSSAGSEQSSDGSDLGLDGLMFPMPPARTVVVDVASGQGWQEVSPSTEFFPPSSPASVARNGVSVHIHTPSTSSAEQSPASPHTALPSPAARSLTKSEVYNIVRSILPKESRPESPSSPCPLVTVTMPSERCLLSRSAPPSPGLLSPVPLQKLQRAIPTPGEVRTHTYKTDVADMLPAKLLFNRDEKVAIDAPRWSDLVSFCRANEDTIIREAVSASTNGNVEPHAFRRLQVCVWEVGEYNDDGNGRPDINDPKYFRVQMTLTVRPEAPPPLCTSLNGRSRSPNSVYSMSSPANSAHSLQSPSFTTPALSQDTSTPPSALGDSSEPPSAFSDSSCPSSALISAVSFQLKDLELTPLTTPDGSLLGLSNLDVDAPSKTLDLTLDLPATASSGLASPAASDSCMSRGRTRERTSAYEALSFGGPTGLLTRELILSFTVPMPTVLGQIVNVASQRSLGEGVARI